MKSALVDRLAADAAVAAIVAAAGDGEKAISWHGFQRGDGYPAIALAMISPGEEWTHEGPDGLNQAVVQFDLRANDADTLESLAEAVIAEMHGPVAVSGWRFHEGMLEAERAVDLGEQDGGALLFHVQLDFMFYHEEIGE